MFRKHSLSLLPTYFDLAAVKNMGDIKDVYWWKVTYIVLVQIHKYSIFYITHGQTPCPWWSVVYRQSGWQWSELYKGSKPTATASVLPVSLHRTANNSNSPALGSLAQLAGSVLLCGCLAHPCFGVLSNFLHMVLSVMLQLWQFLSSPTVVQLKERTTSAEGWISYRLFKSGFSQSPMWLAVDDIRVKKISVQPFPLEKQMGSPITSTSFWKSERYYKE